MAYGIIKVDNVIFTYNAVDATTTFSGFYASTTNNLTLSGTATAATFTGTTANFTNVNVQNISSTTLLSGLAITGGTAGFTTVTGTTVTGTTANFVTVSGTTVTGTTANFVSGVFTNLEITTSGSLSFEGATADNFETFLNVVDPTVDRTITLPDATGTVALLSAVQSYSAAQRGTISALTDGATITADFAVANNFSVTLGGNRTLANPSNQTAGQSGCIWITQDGTGSRTLAYGSQWDFTGGTAPTLSTAAAAVDCLVYAVQSSTKITASLITNLS
jgi:hypothetical protein